MKIKTNLTLEKEVVDRLKARYPNHGQKSWAVNKAIREFLERNPKEK